MNKKESKQIFGKIAPHAESYSPNCKCWHIVEGKIYLAYRKQIVDLNILIHI